MQLIFTAIQLILSKTKFYLNSSKYLIFLFNVFVGLQALPFLLLPDAAKIRPIGWVFITVMIGLFLTIWGLVFVLQRYRTEPNKFTWFIGLLFVLCPIPTTMASLHLMVVIKGFELLP